MDKTVVLFSLFALFVIPAIAQDNEYGKLDAEYHITGKDLGDPMPEDKRDRVSFFIKGESAKAIYDAMLTPARRIDCDGTPMEDFELRKVAGDLECSRDEQDRYFCRVAIKLDTGETTTAAVCDPTSVE